MRFQQTLSVVVTLSLLISAGLAGAGEQGENAKPVTVAPVAILTGGKVSISHENHVTIYTVETTKQGAKEKLYKITGDFKIVTDGTVLDTTDNGNPVVRIFPNESPSSPPKTAAEKGAVSTCELTGGPPGGYRCHGICDGTDRCVLVNNNTNRYCTCQRAKVSGGPWGATRACGTSHEVVRATP